MEHLIMSTLQKALGRVILVPICLLPAITMANSGFQVSGALGTQSKGLEYQFLGIKINPTFQTLSYSLAVASGHFFASAELETMIQGDTQYIGNVASSTTTTIDSTRSDSALTFGYSLRRGLSMFAGYKTGETGVSSKLLSRRKGLLAELPTDNRSEKKVPSG
jgi:hypothetical protein